MDIRWLTLFLDVPRAEGEAAERFWSHVTGTHLSARRGPDDEFVTLVPPRGHAYLRMQRLAAGAGRVHLDLHVDAGAIDAAAARAVALGARARHREEGEVTVLESPGGFPFCLVRWDGETTVPDPDTGAGPNRLDQLCVDVPPQSFEAEFAFWAELTGWEPRSSSVPGFRSLARPAGLPVRMLFQRLDDGARVTGHPDFACDDRGRVAARHTAAGARVVATFPHWTTMADPAGRPYCLTDRSAGGG